MKYLSWILILSLASCLFISCSPSPTKPVVENPPKAVETPKAPSKNEGYVYRHRDTATPGNDREAYIWEVMEAALEATVKDYGPYVIEPVKDINQEREDYEMIHDTGLITITSDSLNQNNLDHLSLLKFPVMRDLLGYRIFLIDKKRQAEFSKVKTVEDLKAFQFGIGIGWNDKIVLEHAGLKVYEESEYKLLFKDVTSGVIDVFSRGINEVVGEYEVYSKTYANLAIEEDLLLYYPLPRYFWFSKSAHGDDLKARLEVGLKRIYDSGKLEDLFKARFEANLKKLHLKDRRVIQLENPLYTESFKINDAPYSYDPLK